MALEPVGGDVAAALDRSPDLPAGVTDALAQAPDPTGISAPGTPPAPTRLAMDRTAGANKFQIMKDIGEGGGGFNPAEVIAPASARVQQAIDLLERWLPINERNAPAVALRKNIEIMKRGGPMAERMADHTLKTWSQPPAGKLVEPPTIEVTPEEQP
jgi:hypothetical protein